MLTPALHNKKEEDEMEDWRDDLTDEEWDAMALDHYHWLDEIRADEDALLRMEDEWLR